MDEDLERHIIEKQIIPQQKAAEYDNVDTFFVSTDPAEDRGVEVECALCHRRARMFGINEQDLSGRVTICPDCLPME
jgi:peptide subunit release factor 1 (eRF1)